MADLVELYPIGVDSVEAVGVHYILQKIRPSGLASVQSVPTPTITKGIHVSSIATEEAIGAINVRVEDGSGVFETMTIPDTGGAIETTDKGNDTIKVLEITPAGDGTFKTLTVRTREAADVALTIQPAQDVTQTPLEVKTFDGDMIAQLLPGAFIVAGVPSPGSGTAYISIQPDTFQDVVQLSMDTAANDNRGKIRLSDINQADDIVIAFAAVDVLSIKNAGMGTGVSVEFEEMTTPGAGAANTGRLYCRDNGSGKTQLVMQFASGSPIVIATQP